MDTTALTVWEGVARVTRPDERARRAMLGAAVARIGAGPRGQRVAAMHREAAAIGSSSSTVRRAFYEWQQRGEIALADKRKLPKAAAGNAWAGVFQRYCENDLNTSTNGYRAMMADFRAGVCADGAPYGEVFGAVGTWREVWAREHPHERIPESYPSGYVPVGGVVISADIAATFDERVFPGGLTYSGHPLATASIVASIDAMKEVGVVENAAMIGEKVLGPGLRALQEKHPVIGEVRGLGVFWALDLVTNRATRAPLAPYGGTSQAMTDLVVECKARGLMPFANFNRMHVVPPCTVTVEEAEAGLAILDDVFTIIDKYYEG
jgi:hypothetical protein